MHINNGLINNWPHDDSKWIVQVRAFHHFKNPISYVSHPYHTWFHLAMETHTHTHSHTWTNIFFSNLNIFNRTHNIHNSPIKLYISKTLNYYQIANYEFIKFVLIDISIWFYEFRLFTHLLCYWHNALKKKKYTIRLAQNQHVKLRYVVHNLQLRIEEKSIHWNIYYCRGISLLKIYTNSINIFQLIHVPSSFFSGVAYLQIFF